MITNVASTPSLGLVRFKSPKSVISRFIARRTIRSAFLWGLVFGIYVASKAIGFVDLYPTAAARQKIAETFSSNIGIELILGKAPHAATTAAYVAWNTGSTMVLIGAIWAFLLATKLFRGEEDAGRWEVLVAGQTTARRATANVLAGLTASLLVLFAVCTLIFTVVGKSHGVDFNASAASFFALCTVLGIAVFLLIGALASQLMPTPSRAASLSAAVFGIFFLLRAIADITSLHWLIYVTPLGWIEKLQPLSNSQPLWLIPILGLISLLVILTVFFAGRRDLGESIFADKATAKPQLGLLNSPLKLAIRLTRVNNIGWLSGFFVVAILFGLITKSAAQVFAQSASFEKVVNRLAQQTETSSVLAFLGIVFFLLMIIIMMYAASGLAAIRREEAEGYVDNLLVRPISRLRWLSGRMLINSSVIIVAGLLTMIGVWIGIATQHISIPFHELFLASLNAIVPALITLGVGLFVFGIWPRLTSALAYGVLAWSFLIEMVSSGIKINHWILHTSILHQVVLAPAANPKWKANLIIIIISLVLCLLGLIFFGHRDLEVE